MKLLYQRCGDLHWNMLVEVPVFSWHGINTEDKDFILSTCVISHF